MVPRSPYANVSASTTAASGVENGVEEVMDPEQLPMSLAKFSFLKQLGGKKFAKPKKEEKKYIPNRVRKMLKKFIKSQENPPETYDQKGNTVILMGETGCGKSTQVPKIIHRWLRKKYPGTKKTCIAITEPRRLAAITLAARVKEELKPKFDGFVAHSVRFDTNYSKNTRIHFLTEGILVQQIISDPFLLDYNVVIVDEAHERSIATDLILGHLKKLVYYRHQVALACKQELIKLKVVIMTATGEAESLQEFFPGSKVLFIEGRTHPVKINYLTPSNNSHDYLSLTAATVIKLHSELPIDEHFLVFLTGQEEIDGIVRLLKTTKHHVPIYPCPLYAALPKKAQENAFVIPPEGTRKIVVATNIAETSLTIPGIKVVIDSGHIKSKQYLATHGLEAYQVQMISQSQAAQRAGRAGRECPGQVYRLYTSEQFETAQEYEEPEIKRSNLTQLHLMLPYFHKLDGHFEFMTEIDPEVSEEAKLELEALDLIDPLLETKHTLTEFGILLSRFPLEPKLATVLHYSFSRGVLDQVSAIISVMEAENLFLPSKGGNEIQKFVAPEGDLITYLNIYNQFAKSKNSKIWCERNRISYRSMIYAVRVRKQLMDLMRRYMETTGATYTPKRSDSTNTTIIHCFGTKIHWQKAIMDPKGKYYRVQNIQKLKNSDRLAKDPEAWGQRYKENPETWQLDRPARKVLHAKIHPTSTLALSRPTEIIFMKATLNERNDLFLHHCSIYDEAFSNLGGNCRAQIIS